MEKKIIAKSNKRQEAVANHFLKRCGTLKERVNGLDEFEQMNRVTSTMKTRRGYKGESIAKRDKRQEAVENQNHPCFKWT